MVKNNHGRGRGKEFLYFYVSFRALPVNKDYKDKKMNV